MYDFFEYLFDSTDFVARRECGHWPPELVWVHTVSDAAIWLAYLAIPFGLLYLARRRKDMPVKGMFWLFIAFILSCGFTHFLDVVVFFKPVYRLSGLVKMTTAVVSWATVLAFIPVTPRVLSLRSAAQLEREIQERTAELARANTVLRDTNTERQRAAEDLRRAHDELEMKVEQRTLELKQVNTRLQRSLEEKDVLLKEIHHRVKNNLQVISSLLHLQSQHTHDHESVEMFRESQHRVRSMALVHERLYRSKDLALVDFTDYIETLANFLFRSYQVDTERIVLAVDVHGVQLSIDAAVPCGLLLNELISNSLKHAFKGRDRGRINIELTPLTETEVLLYVSDDGVGLPSTVDPNTADTFGMQLVAALVDQLHGRVEVERTAGTTMRIVFPLAN